MSKKITTAILGIFLSFSAISQSYTIMTFNIRYDNPADGPDNWQFRKQDMVKFIEAEKPTIFGIQEGLHHQVTYLKSNLENYEYIGVGRDDGETKGEYCAIFYRSDQVTVIKSETFWLSETPDKVSVGWDASMERISTYGLFQDKSSKKEFLVFNTHFDHRGPEAREQSAKLMVSKVNSINTELLPVVVMGDLNATPEQPPITVLMQHFDDARELSGKSPLGPEGTSNGFKGKTGDRRIDYIFTKKFLIHAYKHLDARTEKDRNLSDHLPVLTDLSMPE